ncbi:MAG: hypothetical protein DMG24_15250 [Acidobacteria bacterium]|nr:MAG: hypothetical protein DMG24_15250 [Acidobacteriota bacterium]
MCRGLLEVQDRKEPTAQGTVPWLPAIDAFKEEARPLAVCDERGRAVKALPYGALKEQAGILPDLRLGETE